MSDTSDCISQSSGVDRQQPEISSPEPLDQQVIASLGAYYQELYKRDG